MIHLPPRVNEYAKTLEKARLNGGNRMDSNLMNHCWWIQNAKGVDGCVAVVFSCTKDLMPRNFRMLSKNVSFFT